MLDWDDLKPILALARGGTLSAAAKELGIDATTVGRRVQGAEAAMGARLFDRIDGRFSLTAAGELAMQHGETVEREILSLEGKIAGQDQSLEGRVRLTSLTALINHLLLPCLPKLLASFPALCIELDGANANLSLSRLEADLALRLGRPQDGRDRLRKVGTLHYAVYAAKEAADGGEGLPWLGYTEGLQHVPEATWLRRRMEAESQTLVRANQLETLRRLTVQGAGRSVLPLLVGEEDPGLARISGPEPVVSRDIWLVVHPDLRKTARVSAVVDWILGDCMARLALFSGGN